MYTEFTTVGASGPIRIRRYERRVTEPLFEAAAVAFAVGVSIAAEISAATARRRPAR